MTVNGTTARASRTLVRGDEIGVVELADSEPPRPFAPHDIPLEVVYEDDDLAVINKPAGLVVHPAPGHWEDTLVNALVARGTTLAGGAEGRPGIVHRLDRDTSGLMLVAKTEQAHRKLAAMIAARRVVRIYAALIWGHFDEPHVIIDAPIGRSLRDRKRMAILAHGSPGAHRRVGGGPAGPDGAGPARTGDAGAPTRSGCTSNRSGTPSSATRSTAAADGSGSRDRGGPRRGRSRRWRPARRSTRTALIFRHPIRGTPLELVAPWPEDLWPLLQTAAGGAGTCRTGSARWKRWGSGGVLRGRGVAADRAVSEAERRPGGLVIGAAGTRWLLPVTGVVAVLRQPEVIRVPGAVPAVKGLVHHRGRIIPVADVIRALELPGASADGNDLVVVDSPAGQRFAVAVDAVIELTRGAAGGAGRTRPGADRRGDICMTQRPEGCVAQRILICDDAIFMRTMIADILTAAGIRDRRRSRERAAGGGAVQGAASPTWSPWTS